MDQLYIKHNVRMADIMHAEKTYQLSDDAEINAIKNAHKQKREESRKNKANEAMKKVISSITAEEKAEI